MATATDIVTLFADIATQSGAATAASIVAGAYCVVADLNTEAYFCVDSTGKASVQTTPGCSTNACY